MLLSIASIETLQLLTGIIVLKKTSLKEFSTPFFINWDSRLVKNIFKVARANFYTPVEDGSYHVVSSVRLSVR